MEKLNRWYFILWTACHGYNNKHIRKNIISQLNLMPHVMFGGLVHDQAVLLSKRLSKLLNNKLEKYFLLIQVQFL